jgi:3-oxoacyl-[acyl-carrier protein] reductase
VVVGAGQGIGKAVAERFAARGDRIVAADLVESKANMVATLIAGRGAGVDVTDEASVAQLFDTVIEQEGRLDVVVSTAGILRFGTNLLNVALSEWEEVVRVNLTGGFLCAREAARRMAPHSGASIVIVSSGAGTIANQNQVAYNSSKAGLSHFIRSAAMDLADLGIRVNGIAPGPIATPMTDAFSEDRRAYMASGVPLARLGRSDEIASAAFFLASYEADYITGEIIAIDGGVTVAGRLARHLPK